MRSLLLVAVIATPLSAQSLDPRYESIGTFDGMVQDTNLTLTALFDREKNRSMVQLRDASGFTAISISARSIANDGTPTSPSVSFTIGPLGAGVADVRSDIFFSNEDGYFVADVDNSNRAVLSDFTQGDTTISFGVIADLVPVKRSDDGFIVDDDRTNLQLSGTFSGTFTDVD
jgi:hypothetical protein